MGTLQVSGSTRHRHALPGLAAGLFLASAALPAAGAPPAFGPASPLASNAASDTRNDAPPALAAGANGTWIAVWESNDYLGGPLGGDSDVLHARSPDGGATWSAPTPLDPLAATDSAADGEPAVASDGHGTWIATWRSNRRTATTLGDFDVFVTRSIDDGLTWSTPQVVHPQLASDARQDGQPTIAADGQGNWVLAWRSAYSEIDAFFAHSADGGVTWSAPAPFHGAMLFDGASDQRPALASDGAGEWIAVWASVHSPGSPFGRDADLFFARSSDAGASWTAPSALHANATGDVGHDTAPDVAADGAGGWLVVWESSESFGGTLGADLDVLAARSTDGGASWSDPAPVHAYAAGDGSADAAPALVCSAARRCAVAWQSNDPLGATLGADLDVLLAASEDGGATWGAPAALDPRAAHDQGADTRPALETDGLGVWMAAWQSTDTFGETIGADTDPLVAVGIEPPVCGDAVLYPAEACDDGNLVSGDGCRADCTVERCGDAILDAGEACDDGNATSGDGCRSDCTAELCGDGLRDPGETCDDGNLASGDGCRFDCSVELCGDGLLDPGEGCDDGNADDGDGCDAACQVEAPPPTRPGPGSLLDFFDAAVAEGTLVGTGRPATARGRLRVLRLWLALATDWIDESDRQRVAACALLDLSLRRVDGRPRPADTARGPAAAELAQRIAALAEAAGCRSSCGKGHGHGHDDRPQ